MDTEPVEAAKAMIGEMESLDEPTRLRLLNKYIHATEKLEQEEFAAELRSRLS
ncbi:MAG: hypothetical protein WA030_01840 [Candidatus Microsaccharimonas sp.]